MKRLLIIALAAFSLLACNIQKRADTAGKVDDTTSNSAPASASAAPAPPTDADVDFRGTPAAAQLQSEQTAARTIRGGAILRRRRRPSA